MRFKSKTFFDLPMKENLININMNMLYNVKFLKK